MTHVEPRNVPELPSPGQVIDGRFHIRELLGDGGMGHVYRAYDEAAGREVAFKLLIIRYLGRPERELRVFREAELGSRAQHDHLVKYVEAGRFGEHQWPYLVSELVKGQDLGFMLAAGPLPDRLAARLARQVAGALRALHAAGVVHRDVTDANVLVDGDHATLIDLSHAGDLSLPRVPVGQPGRITRLNEVPGTHLYMSREQANAEPADPSMDVFAFGVTLIHMITGVAPRGYGREEYIEMKRRGLLKSPRIDPRVYPNAPPLFLELANACVHEDAAQRPTMNEVVDRLDRLLASMVVPAEATHRVQAANDQGPTGRDPSAPTVRRRPKPGPDSPIIDAEARSKPAPVIPTRGPRDPAAEAPADVPNRWRHRLVVPLLALLVGALLATALLLLLISSGKRTDATDSVSTPVRTEHAADQPPQPSPQPTPVPADVATGTTSGSEASDSAESIESTGPAEHASQLTEPEQPPSAEPDEPTPPKATPHRQPKPATNCPELRAKVDRAVNARDWRAVLRHTRSGACWDQRAPRVDLRVYALQQLGRWEECIKLARTVDSVESNRAATRCAAALKASNQ